VGSSDCDLKKLPFALILRMFRQCAPLFICCAMAHPSVAHPNVSQRGSLRGAGRTESEMNGCDQPFTTCGFKRCSDTPFDVPSSLNYGYLNDYNQGGDKDKYRKICSATKEYDLSPPEHGNLLNFTIAHCSDNSGSCPLYRVFDKKHAWPCGHWWAPPTSIEGKTLTEYFRDVDVCSSPDSYYNFSVPTKPGSPGQKGGFRMKCFAPYGYIFTLGPGQSSKCLSSDQQPYTLPASPALQVVWDTDIYPYSALQQCTMCVMKKDEHGNVPDATACEDGTEVPVELNATFCNR